MSKPIEDYQLQGQTQKATAIAWSPDGTLLASCYSTGDIQLWDTEDGSSKGVIHSECSLQPCLVWSSDSEKLAVHTSDSNSSIKLWSVADKELLTSIDEHTTKWTSSLAWSPDGEILAAGSSDGAIRLWNAYTGKHIYTLYEHDKKVSCMLWSPDHEELISGSADQTITLWDARTWRKKQILRGHSREVSCLAWLTQENLIVSGSADRTIRLWDPETGQEKRKLEAHTANITSIAAFNKSHLLATRAEVVRVWSTKTWAPVKILEESSSSQEPQASLTFHPNRPLLALLRDEDTSIRIVDMQEEQNPEALPVEEVTHYKSAKVVLVGESGVGKSALAHVVMGERFKPQPSSHGRQIFPFESARKQSLKNGIRFETDTRLWDLAGQSSYRLIHQLHLKDVTVALILFDYHSGTDPFAGVDDWLKALRQAEKEKKEESSPMKKLLIAARTDVGGRKVSAERIEEFGVERGFDGYYETSAMRGKNIKELIQGIKDIIDWDALTPITSLALFQHIKDFLLWEQKKGLILAPIENLYDTFQAHHPDLSNSSNPYDQFKEGIDLAASSGLIHKLSFNNYVLLRPELIDAYASALVNKVSNEPDGTGSIRESEALEGNFELPEEMRIANKDQEKTLLLAMVEELIRSQVALRYEGFLVFPSQSTREHPEMPDLKEKNQTITFTFEGAVANVYALLTVRLSRSESFKQTEVWKGTTVYTAWSGSTCGIVLENIAEGKGRITTLFDANISKETRLLFEGFVEDCLKKTALTLKRERIFTCKNCKEVMKSSQVIEMRDRGYDYIHCHKCGTKISLDEDERAASSDVEKMQDKVDENIEKDAANIGKTKQYHVFFSYNDSDRDEVRAIAEQLKKKDLRPWLDEEMQPGKLKQSEREKQIMEIKCAALFIGEDEAEPSSLLDREAVLGEYQLKDYPIIPVLLSNAPKGLKLPPYLGRFMQVDFRHTDPDPIKQLIWGITGKRP